MGASGSRWLVAPSFLAVITIAASAVWGVASVIDGDSFVRLLPVAVTTLLVVVADQVRRRSGLDSQLPVLPSWFVPVVVLISAVGAVAVGVAAAVEALVMASPAAAILAVPAAFGVGARRARSAGIRLDSLSTIDAATRIDTLVLEKDGTLTTGDLTVISVDPHDPDHDRNIRWFAGALEHAAENRVGKALATLSGRGRITGVEMTPDVGISGSVDRHPVRVGSPDWVGVAAPATIWTAVGVEVDGRALGTITVADDVRPGVAKDVARLADLGLDLILVSSDTVERTRHVAELAKVSTVHASCGREDTHRIVGELSGSGRRVATVGMTDTPGAELTISTIESGGIVADDCSPARIADALHIARSTAARIAQARWLTITLGLIGAAAGATGVAGPIVAAVVATAIVVVAAVAARP